MQNTMLYACIGVEIVTLLLLLLIFLKYRRLYKAYDIFMRGKDAETLENTIIALGDEIRDLRA